jgi:hypothetical protein
MTTNDYRLCNTCKQEKPLSEFYKRYNGDPLYDCKECMKIRSRNQKQAPRQVAVNKSEKIIIERLAQLCIPALPGKALGYRWADVVAWGCVLIECKLSTDKGGGSFQWAFSPKQFTKGLRAHVVILCAEHHEGVTVFHVFDASDPVFYHDTGERKTAVGYGVNSRHRMINRVVLTDEMMLEHKDNWSLIEQYRQSVSLGLTKSLLDEWRVK